MALKSKFGSLAVSNLTTIKNYVVYNCTTLNVRTGPDGKTYPSIKTLQAGAKVKAYAKAGSWYRIALHEEKWVHGAYLKYFNTDNDDSSDAEDESETNTDYKSKLTNKDPKKKKTLTEAEFQKIFSSYKNTFGAPFTFTDHTDPHYFDTEKFGKGVGRAMLSTMYANPSVFSICPGKVAYLPGFNQNEKDDFLNRLSKKITSLDLDGAKDEWHGDGVFSGKLYEFSPNYDDYMNRFNVLARTSAIMLGLGETYMPGTKVKLANYDYSWYTTAKRSTKGSTGLFGSISNTLSSAITDDQYIHFFLTNEGSAVSEDFSTTTTESVLKGLINDSKLNDSAKNLAYLFGGAMDSDGFMSRIGKDVDELMSKAGSSGTYIGSFASMFNGYLKGGRMVIPDMIDNVMYKNAVSCRMKFVSIYGSKLSIFLQTILPTLAILNFVIPKQIADNMYTYPYIIRCFQQGWYNTDLAVIEGLRIVRGGPDDIGWTVDGLSTEITVEFDIVPLYSSMMSASSRNPYLFLSNTPLLEYLGNLCGVDLKLNQIDTKWELAKSLVKNYATDVPATLGRRAAQGITNKLTGIFNFD